MNPNDQSAAEEICRPLTDELIVLASSHTTAQLSTCTLFFEAGYSWSTVRGVHLTTWVKSVKAFTSGLARVGEVRLQGWGPRGPPKQWLETVGDIAQRRSQLHTCIRNPSSSM